MSDQSERATAYGILSAGWRIVDLAGRTALGLELADAVLTVVGTGSQDRLPTALFSGGWVLFIGIIVYGLSQRYRWSTYVASVLSVGNVVLIGVALLFSFFQGMTVYVNGIPVTNTPLTLAVGFLKLLAYAGVIVGIVRVLTGWRLIRHLDSMGPE